MAVVYFAGDMLARLLNLGEWGWLLGWYLLLVGCLRVTATFTGWALESLLWQKQAQYSIAVSTLVKLGGVLLMLPGFLTDIIGFLFLLRWSRPFARKVIAFFVARRINRLGIPVMRARLDRENLIEGETVETPSTSRLRPQDPTIIAGEIEEPSASGRPEDPR